MDAGGVTSMASPWSESTDLVAEGSIGMFLSPLWCGSPENGLRGMLCGVGVEARRF